ncbi:16S rRNA (cytosine(967)-C(5))-methyltransferase RsmB, partial [candidate division KSB1 bacterium]|nr:16S rRNA (cytosine(967)-C(5))-methyltransferase RsmB [candidate division KSB1 bacterium]
GLGVLSKRADLRWKRKQHHILNIRKIQKKLLTNAARLLKQKGTLAYSTCTLEPEENEELIEEFLKEHAEFRIGLDSESLHKTFSTPKGYWTSVPYEHKMDGVFAVKLIKSN